MKIKYMEQYRHYKPEYDIADFVRVNCMDNYNPRVVLKLMQKLYPLRLRENRPDLMDDEYDTDF